MPHTIERVFIIFGVSELKKDVKIFQKCNQKRVNSWWDCFFMELLPNHIHFLILCIVDFKGYGSKQNPFYMCQTLIFQEALYYWKKTLDTTFRAYYWADSIVSQYKVSLSCQLNLKTLYAWFFMGNKSYLILRLFSLRKKNTALLFIQTA